MKKLLFFYVAESVFRKTKTITALKDISSKNVTTKKETVKTAQTL